MRVRNLEERFWPKVDRPSTDNCWPWLGFVDGAGYGRFRIGGQAGKSERASRVMWTLVFGPIPEGQCVCHRCDNPRCVNPDHLFLGSHAENMADMARKGRAGPRKNPGERASRAKFTNAEAAAMREAYEAGESTNSIARRLGLNRSTVYYIVSGRRYGCLKAAEGTVYTPTFAEQKVKRLGA